MLHRWPLTDADVAGSARSSAATPAVPPAEAARPRRLPPPPRLLSPLELKVSFAVSGVLLGLAVVLTPVARVTWPAVPSFIVSYMTGLIMLDLLVGMLLLSKGRIEGDHGNVLLSMAYFFSALILLPYTAAFPDAFRPGPLLGAAGSASWIWAFWHFGFAALVLRYTLSSPRVPKAVPRARTMLLVALLLAGAATLVALQWASVLPKLFVPGRPVGRSWGSLIIPAVLLINLLAEVAAAARYRFRRIEDLWLTVGMLGACVDIWLTFCGQHRYSVGWYCGRLCGLSTSFVLFAFLMNDVLIKYRSVTVQNDVLDHLSLTDALTQLGNRRMFDRILQNEWRRCRRDNLPLAIVLFDVDNFKSYNDTYGHQAGDGCLQSIAARLSEAASRAGDLAVRYGGEEFALILPATDQAGAEYLARQVRMMVRGMGIPHSGSQRKIVTISAGLASLVPAEPYEASELVRLADLALYEAKARGRDAVVAADRAAPPPQNPPEPLPE